MHLGKELLRTCLAGLAVHLIVVSACSAGEGADGSPEYRLTNAADSGRGQEPSEVEPTHIGHDAGQTPSLLLPVAEAKAQESGSRLKARWYVGDDGSRQFLGWYDAELKTDCSFGRGFDGALHCLPSVGVTTTFTDADCSQPIFSQTSRSCADGPPVIGSMDSVDGASQCAVYRQRYFAVGAEVVPEALYMLSGSLCKEATVDPSRTYWSVASEIPLSRFVSGEIVTE